MDVQNEHQKQGIQVIARAADILRTLGRSADGLSLGQISKSVQLPRSTVQRIVSALSLEGFVSTKNGHGRIRLGSELQTLALAPGPDLRERLRPLMQEISSSTTETVDLAVLKTDKMLFIDQIVGSQRLRTVSSIGEVFPLTTTANGKAALSCLNVATAKMLILEEVKLNSRSDIDSQKLLEEISRIRAGALAHDENEHTEGICALGFAISGQTGEIYAISVPVPASRFERNKIALANQLNKSRAAFMRELRLVNSNLQA